jgi:hypothetical protein
MPFTTYEIFAALAIIVSLIRPITYLRAIHQGKAKPHTFSWFNWGLVGAITTYAQWQLGGGPSAWIMVVVSVTCFYISYVGLRFGEKNITRTDWYAFIGTLLAIPVWLITQNPFWALVLIVSIDMLSFYPTIRKSWKYPWDEPAHSYGWSGFRYFLMLFAVPAPTFMTLFYPFFLMLSDGGFALYLLWRRRKLAK